MDNLLKQVQSLLPADNGTWSVYVCNLPKDSEGMINDTPMQAASLIKLYIMGAVYENYDTLSQSHNGDEIDSNISAMITVSDNDAANTLVNWLGNGDDSAGMAKVNVFCQEHGFTSTQMNRLLLAGKENGDNYTSVKDCGTFLKADIPDCQRNPSRFYSSKRRCNVLSLKNAAAQKQDSCTTSGRRRYCQ